MNANPRWKDTTAGFSTNRPPGGDGQRAGLAHPTLTVISHPNVSRIGDRSVLFELAAGKPVSLSRDLPDFLPPGKAWGEPLQDPFLSRAPVLLKLRRDGSVELSPQQSRTTVAVGGLAVPESATFAPAELGAGVALELAGRIVLLLHYSDPDLPDDGPDFGLIGQSDAVISLRREIRRVADLDVPVLLRGASGTGKELVARAIHAAGPRGKRPFVAVNLGAIPTSLAASELFGAARGAFTGAIRDQDGYFKAAHGGSLFLDEIGEAPPELQVLLLRALDSGEICPVGSQLARKVDVRIIAATDADLEDMVRRDSFKSPLLFRLSGYAIALPPLRARREDIGRLLLHFARQELVKIGEKHRLVLSHPKALPWLPAPLVTKLVGYAWPGNVRELRNMVQQMVIGSRGEQGLQAGAAIAKLLDSEAAATGEVRTEDRPVLAREKRSRKPADISEGELLAAMRANRWNYKATARALAISRSSLYTLVESCSQIRVIDEVGEAEIRSCADRFQADTDAMAAELQVSARALQRRLKQLGLA